MAETIDAQLKRMVQDLKEIIDHINTTNTNQDDTDPVSTPLIGINLLGLNIIKKDLVYYSFNKLCELCNDI